jgi:hypothetical protein
LYEFNDTTLLNRYDIPTGAGRYIAEDPEKNL